MASSEDDLMDVADDVGGLFDDSDEEPAKQLSDRELDSGDDENRNDGAPKEDEDEEDLDISHRNTLTTEIHRHTLPKPFDGELNTLRMPTFLGIEPRAYDPTTFKIPTSDHHVDHKSSNFSASAVAASTMRFRKNPSSGKHESNTVVYRWSDGSTTIAVGDQHYELQSKSLVPPKDSKIYNEVQDSHLYLASPSVEAQMLITVGHMANQYTVRPNKDIQDDAVEKLKKGMAAATRGIHKTGDDRGGPELITNTEDPEIQRKKAEIAEKERNKLQRRRENAAEKANAPKHSLGGRGGLNVDDLEGRAGRRAPGNARKGPKPRRRRADYDTDDSNEQSGLPRGRNREDEYDKEDDFLASSDEELEEGGDDDEEEELLDDDEDSEREEPKSKRQKTSKPATADSDADAEGDADNVAPAADASTEPAGRGRKRMIIDDDEDDE